MTISSPGIGSNLDVNGIVAQLMRVESQPLIGLAKQEASFQAQLSAYGNIKSALASFQTAATNLSDPARFQSVKATSSDATIFAATATSSASPGSYTLEVSKLAQAQKLIAAGQTSTSTAIGVGTVTFDFGTISGGTFNAATGTYTGATFTSNGSGTKSVVIDSTNNTLAGIRDAINKAAVGVTATIVNDGSGTPYRLSLTSAATGQTYSAKISVAGDAALATLLANDPAGTQNLSEKVTAQNAALTVDGVSISKSSNTISDVIQGVTLTLNKTNVGAPANLAVAYDTAATKTLVQGFVKSYNDIQATLGSLSAYNSSTKQGAILQGDFTVQSIQARLRSTLNSALTGVSGSYTTLSQIGITFQKDGTLAADDTKLQAALNTSFKDVAALFAAVGKSSDSLINYTSYTSKTQPGTYALNVTQLATQGNTVGSAAANLTITAGSNDALNVTVDGISTTVTLAAGTYATADALALQVQSAINGASAFSSAGLGVKVTQAAGVLTIASSTYGSTSIANITGGNGRTGLLGAAPTVMAGLNVAGTLNGATATGSGQYLSGATGDNTEGLRVQVTGGITGARGSISFSQGYAYKLQKIADNLVATDGAIASRTDGINSSIKQVGARRDALNLRLADIEKRYRAQFTALDTLLSKLTQTSGFLTQQLASLPKIS